ncbi:uncharacterized protein LOC126848600 [Cataglyphis hispanica]|uniref:uncharacterized protein LOC126848600 n=1 Tax=Cataglyphis hispanica TaxID=1086592 RepID=UPI00217F3CE9|nr:uncharacterized protein LOC126848600 [Cataglyphis hispanica]
MNREQNYEDRIKFIIALMTEDYANAHNFGNQLLKSNQNDADIIRALNILKQKNQHKIEKCERLSSIDSPIESDNECGGSDATDDEDVDFVDDNVDSRIDPRATSKIASHGMPQLNINKPTINLDFKQRMHRVIPIKIDKKAA